MLDRPETRDTLSVPADIRRDLTGTGLQGGRVRGVKKDLMQEVVRLAGDRERWRGFIHSGARFRPQAAGGLQRNGGRRRRQNVRAVQAAQLRVQMTPALRAALAWAARAQT